MGGRRLEIVLISANQLPTQNSKYQMAVAAKAYISSKPDEAQTTRPDRNGGPTPTWDQTFHFHLKYSGSFGRCGDSLHVQLLNMIPDGKPPACIGAVEIQLSDWIALAGRQATGDHFQNFQLSLGGNIHLSYRLGPYHSKVGQVLRGVGSAVPIIGLAYAVGHDNFGGADGGDADGSAD